MDDQGVERILRKLEELKSDFLTKEAFFAYHSMLDKDLNGVGNKLRGLEKKIDDNISDDQKKDVKQAGRNATSALGWKIVGALGGSAAATIIGLLLSGVIKFH